MTVLLIKNYLPWKEVLLTLCMLWNCDLLPFSDIFFQNQGFQKISFMNTISLKQFGSTSGQNRFRPGLILIQTVCKGDHPLTQARQTVKHYNCYSKTCVKQPLSKRPKNGFQDQLSLNACQKRSILQYFRPSLSTEYHLLIRSLFCLFYTCFTVERIGLTE